MSLIFKEITREKQDVEQLQRFAACRTKVVSVALSALLPDVVGVTVEKGFVELIDVSNGKFRLFLTYLEGERIPLESSLRCFSLIPCLLIAAKVGVVEYIKKKKMLSETTAKNPSLGPSSLPFSHPTSPNSFDLGPIRGDVETFFLYSLAHSNQILIAEVNSGAVIVLAECESRPSILSSDADYIMCGEGTGKVSVWNLTSILLASAEGTLPSKPRHHLHSSGKSGNSMVGNDHPSIPHHHMGSEDDIDCVHDSAAWKKNVSGLRPQHMTWLSAVLQDAAAAAPERGGPSCFHWTASPDGMEGCTVTALSRCRYQLFCMTADFRCTILHVGTGVVLGKLLQEYAPLVSLRPIPSAEERGLIKWGVHHKDDGGEVLNNSVVQRTMIGGYSGQLALYRESVEEYVEPSRVKTPSPASLRMDGTFSPANTAPIPPPIQKFRVYGYEGGCQVPFSLSCLTCSLEYIAAGTHSGVILLYKCLPSFGRIKEIHRFDVGCPVMRMELLPEQKETILQNDRNRTSRTECLRDPTMAEVNGGRPRRGEDCLNDCLLVVTAEGDVWRWALKELLFPLGTDSKETYENGCPDDKAKIQEDTESQKEKDVGMEHPMDLTTPIKGSCTPPSTLIASTIEENQKTRVERGEVGISTVDLNEDEECKTPTPSPSTRIPVPTSIRDTERRRLSVQRSEIVTKNNERERSDESKGKTENSKFVHPYRSGVGVGEEMHLHHRTALLSHTCENVDGRTRKMTQHSAEHLSKGKEKEFQTAYMQWRDRIHHLLSLPSSGYQNSATTSRTLGTTGNGGSTCSNRSDNTMSPHHSHSGEQKQGGIYLYRKNNKSISGLRNGGRMDPREVDAVLSNAAARDEVEGRVDKRSKKVEEVIRPSSRGKRERLRSSPLPLSSPSTFSSAPLCSTASIRDHDIPDGGEQEDDSATSTTTTPLQPYPFSSSSLESCVPPLAIAQPGWRNSTALQEERAAALLKEAFAKRTGEAMGRECRKSNDISLFPSGGGDTRSGTSSHLEQGLSGEARASPLLVSSLAYRFPIPSAHWRLNNTIYNEVPQIAEVFTEDMMQHAHHRPYHYLQSRFKGPLAEQEIREREAVALKEEHERKCDGNANQSSSRVNEKEEKKKGKSVLSHSTSVCEFQKRVHFSHEGDILPVEKKQNSACKNDNAVIPSAITNRKEIKSSRRDLDDLQEVTQGIIPRKKDLNYEEERRRLAPNIFYQHGCEELLYSFPPSTGGYDAYPSSDCIEDIVRVPRMSQGAYLSGRGERNSFFSTPHPELILFPEYELQPTEPLFFSSHLPLPGAFPLF